MQYLELFSATGRDLAVKWWMQWYERRKGNQDETLVSGQSNSRLFGWRSLCSLRTTNSQLLGKIQETVTSNFAQALTLSLIPYVHVFPSAGLDPVFLRGDRVLRVLQDVHNVLPPASVTPQRNSRYSKILCKGLPLWLILTLFSWIALTHCPVQSEILVPCCPLFWL